MLAMGRSDWLYRWALANCLVGAAAVVVGARWGLMGVSLALAAVVAVLSPFEIRMALRLIEMRLSTYARALVPHVVITAVMAVTAWVVADSVRRLGGGSTNSCSPAPPWVSSSTWVDVALQDPGVGRRASSTRSVGRST